MTRDANVIPPRSDDYIDPMQMARFLVMPGAVKLLEAFSRIPVGSLRDSVISHAEVIAQTYAGAPPDQQMPDPLLTAAQGVQTAPRTAVAALKGPPAKTTEEQIVKLRLAGYDKAKIIEATGATRQKVEGVISMARKGGVKFPPTPKSEQPGGKHFPTRIEDLGPQGRSNIEKAAAQRGHSLQSYMDARATFIRLRQNLKPMAEIAAEVRIDEKTLWQWLYVARAAGIELPTDIDYVDAVIEPGPLPEPAKPHATSVELKAPKTPRPRPLLIPGQQRVFTPVGELPPGALKSVQESATSRNLTLSAFAELREHIVLLRYNGMTAAEIAERSGQEKQFVYNVIHNAQQKGVVFPPRSGGKDASE